MFINRSKSVSRKEGIESLQNSVDRDKSPIKDLEDSESEMLGEKERVPSEQSQEEIKVTDGLREGNTKTDFLPTNVSETVYFKFNPSLLGMNFRIVISIIRKWLYL